MKIAYYFDQSKRAGDFRDEIGGSANQAYLWAYRYAASSTHPQSVWLPDLVRSAKEAVARGMTLHLNCNGQEKAPSARTNLREFFKAFAPYWDSVTCIEAADEPKIKDIAKIVKDVKSAVKAAGLPPKPVGVCFTVKQYPGAPVGSMDVVIVEAYSADPVGDHNSAYNVAKITKYLKGALLAAKKSKKQVIVVIQSYSRNYVWQHIGTLKEDSPAWRQAVKTMVDLIEPIYDVCRADKNVLGMNFFSYGRESGAREYPALKREVLRIGKKAVKA